MGPVCEVSPDLISRLHEVLGWVRDYVKDGKFAAGTGHLTLADICFLATYSTLKASQVIPLDEVKIHNVTTLVFDRFHVNRILNTEFGKNYTKCLNVSMYGNLSFILNNAKGKKQRFFLQVQV
jgi:hypothetical protein